MSLRLHEHRASQYKGIAVTVTSSPRRLRPNELLLASQSPGPTCRHARKQLVDHFDQHVRTITARTCRRYRVHRQEQDDVVAETYQLIFNPTIARFDSNRGDPGSYLQGLVQNGARKVMAQLGARGRTGKRSVDESGIGTAPRSLTRTVHEGVLDERKASLTPAEEVENLDTARFVLGMASGRIRRALKLLYWENWTLQRVASDLGVNRFALSRELRAFFIGIREQLSSS